MKSTDIKPLLFLVHLHLKIFNDIIRYKSTLDTDRTTLKVVGSKLCII